MVYTTIVDGKQWEFRSSSNPSKRYTVILNGTNVRNCERSGMLSCNCPGWIFKARNGNVRTCKHCEEIMNRELMVTEKLEMLSKRKQIYGEV